MKLKRLFLACLLPVCLISPAAAQTSILWEISGNDLQSPSYLMGTLKFMGEHEFFIPKEAHTYLQACKIFAIEDEVDHHAQHELNKVLHFPNGQSLKDVMSADQYNTVQKFFESEFGIGAAKFEHQYAKLKPLAISIAMTRLSLGEKVRFYDIELVKEAKKKKLDTYSLEHIEREAEALNKYPIEDQVKALLHSVENFENQKQEFQALVREYPHGDLEKMFQYTVHPMENNPVFIEEFYTKRNQEWLPAIHKMVHDRPAFIAVGIAHLEGDKGLLALLKEKGYTLKPIPVTR